MTGLEQRFQDRRPIFGLTPRFSGRRWIEGDGGPDNVVDGVSRPFSRLDRGDDWIAFCDIGDECLYVHVQQPNGSSLALISGGVVYAVDTIA